MSRTLICVDMTTALTHNVIKNRAIGASEYQLYNLLDQLKDTISIRCYNHHSCPNIIDSIQYDSFNSLMCNDTDTILIQRFYPIIDTLLAKIKNNKILIWIHDLPDMNIFLGNDIEKIHYYRENMELFKQQILLPILNNPMIHFIANSKHTYDLFMTFIRNHAGVTKFERCIIIYNILYGEEFDTTPIAKIPKRLIYASAWQKGIEKVIDVFRFITKRDPGYTLSLLSPGYDWRHFREYATTLKAEFGDRIVIMGPSTKRELTNAIKESCCCLSSTFNETFGCVFAESYYLGTPVIADKRSGAIREIIGEENIVDYDNKESVWLKLQRLNPRVSLSSIFLVEPNLTKWLALV
jgi:glycosyltransferase involved in cell wall biosynthesis